jgi:ABC-type nitrate/sulfonate/bicarbonate transport system ATPase subunit
MEHPAEGKRFLEISGLCFRYTEKDEWVLENLALELCSGSFTALVGRSGCGKTTLLNVILGFLKPERGKCWFQGKRISGPNASRIPIFQEDGIWPWWSAIDNVLLSAYIDHGEITDKDRRKAVEMLELVGLPKKTHMKYPKELSMGMRRRVELARALYREPDLLIADEPFGSVDVETRESLHELVEGIWRDRGMTILFSTHDLREAMYLASNILVLRSEAPSRVVDSVFNPLQGTATAEHGRSSEYFGIYERLREAMRGDG